MSGLQPVSPCGTLPALCREAKEPLKLNYILEEEGGVFSLSRPLAAALSMGFMWVRYRKTNDCAIFFHICPNTSAYHKPKDSYHKCNFMSFQFYSVVMKSLSQALRTPPSELHCSFLTCPHYFPVEDHSRILLHRRGKTVPATCDLKYSRYKFVIRPCGQEEMGGLE